MVRTTSCTGIDITAGTLVGITALMPDVTTTGTAARTMIGMGAVTMTRGRSGSASTAFRRTLALTRGERTEKDKRCAKL